MIDLGAIINVLALDIVQDINISRYKKARPYQLQLVNDENYIHNKGQINQETKELEIRMPQRHTEIITFDIVPIVDYQIILGTPWLRKYNPTINQIIEKVTIDRYNYKESKVLQLNKENASLRQVELYITLKELANLVQAIIATILVEYKQYRNLFIKKEGQYALLVYIVQDYKINLEEGKTLLYRLLYTLLE